MQQNVRKLWFWILGIATLILAVFEGVETNRKRQVKKIGVTLTPRGEKLVVVFGDSITHGGVSFNYVNLLARRMGSKGYRFLNAGVDSDTALDLLERIAPVIASQPQVVVILIGTNDIERELALGPVEKVTNGLPRRIPLEASLEDYLAAMRQILTLFQQKTTARIGLCSIPVLGEDLDSLSNVLVRKYNVAIRDLVDEFGLAYLPVYEQMETYLRTHQNKPGKAFTGFNSMFMTMFKRAILRQDWDQISRGNGYLLNTDGIHFNSKGGTIIANEIEVFINSC
ncbi:MAG TPA: GDSL-type esterase/lipase family protein [Anaerolineaceae bacterium]|nr:GDSL-type esterase/lipase family protein [Anaerolineaceae bacterium]